MARLAISNTIMAVRTYRTMNELAKIGKARRKAAERKENPVQPLAHNERVRNYANQSGWTADYTPAQRRRMDKKDRRASARANHSHIVDEATSE